MKLTEHFQYGLNSPICLTWELTYACNLACVHCLSSSGRRDPRELTTDECKSVVDELQKMQVFYVNVGGGEPTVRPDFWELLDYAIDSNVGVKFSTNGVKLDPTRARQLARTDYVDVQIPMAQWSAQIVERYATRWSIEPANATGTQQMGVGPAPNRVKNAVERTVPFGMLVQSLVVLWYALYGHHPDDAHARRLAQPWYQSKTEPSFEGMINKLRKTLIVARFTPASPGQPSPDLLHDYALACAAAAA